MDSPEKIQPAPNPKVELAVLCSKHRKTIHYDYQGKGQPHEPRWIAILTLGDTSYTSGEFKKKKDAEEDAASKALPDFKAKLPSQGKKLAPTPFAKASTGPIENYKGMLNEFYQKKSWPPLEFCTESVFINNQVFHRCTVTINEHTYEAADTSKGRAQQEVAKQIFELYKDEIEANKTLATKISQTAPPKNQLALLLLQLKKANSSILPVNPLEPEFDVVRYTTATGYIMRMELKLATGIKDFTSSSYPRKKDAENDCANQAIQHLHKLIDQKARGSPLVPSPVASPTKQSPLSSPTKQNPYQVSGRSEPKVASVSPVAPQCTQPQTERRKPEKQQQQPLQPVQSIETQQQPKQAPGRRMPKGGGVEPTQPRKELFSPNDTQQQEAALGVGGTAEVKLEPDAPLEPAHDMSRWTEVTEDKGQGAEWTIQAAQWDEDTENQFEF